MALAPTVLTAEAVNHLSIAVTSQSKGTEIASMLNAAAAALSLGVRLAGAITATGTSTTTDFGSLVVNDLVVHIPSTAGNAAFTTCATAGTLAVAAVSGDLYIVLRPFTAPSAVTTQF